MTEVQVVQPNTVVENGIEALVKQSGENSRDHGFHEDWPTKRQWDFLHPDEKKQVRRAIAEKLALVHEETSESLGEIRSNRAPLEVYFVDHKGVIGEKGAEYDTQRYINGVPVLKPEGFLVELADAMIRIGDLSYLVGDQAGENLAWALGIKHEYNATRPHKHGREF